MALGRLSIVPDDFLNQAILYTFTRAPAAPMPLTDPQLPAVARLLLRGSVGSDYGKKLRWEAEVDWFSHLASRYYSRNQLLNEPAEALANRTVDSTDILQEYFIPREHFNDFVADMRRILPPSGADLLNVTLRDVRTDPDTFLRYADADMIALVLLFNQKRTAVAEARMADTTRRLIDAALDSGGRYYLPYRLQATPEQFNHAYPQAQAFFQLKRRYDPGELFQNEFYVKYGRPDAGG